MRFHLAALATAVASLSMASGAFAQAPTAGSLLVYPEFDNRVAIANLVTLTNSLDGFVAPPLDSGENSVTVEYIYVDRYTCEEFNRTERLTPNDTLTVLTKFHNPEQVQGYLYVFAKDRQGNPVAFDWLIGSNLVIDGLGEFQYQTNPFVFKAGEGLVEGDLTDLDGDGIRDLNGEEYQEAPDQLLIPRFLGQNNSRLDGDMVLLGLTGGRDFSTTVDLLIYNDNEQVFSAQHTFDCWDKVKLTQMSNAFNNEFLFTQTDHDPEEVAGIPLLESGWVRMDGGVASSQFFSILDPAFLAVFVERVGEFAAADLPFMMGTQDNGDLIPFGPFGDIINNAE